MSLASVVVLSSLLGTASFVTGLLPLTISLSRKHLSRLSVFGTGLLLGAAIGVIIPEGIEAVYDSTASSRTSTDAAHDHAEPPTFAIAISLLSGFIFMLIVEQLSSQLSPPSCPPSPARHSSPSDSRPNMRRSNSGMLTPSRPLSPTTATSITDGDLDLDADLDIELGALRDRESHWPVDAQSAKPERRDPRLFTFGLVIHSLADGLALGASIHSGSSSSVVESEDGLSTSSFGLSSLSLVVFAALILHKAPASLALTSTLITQLPQRVVRTHLAVFSITAPAAAILSYIALSWFSGLSTGTDWTGKALLFSGGTFLYVATLLSPIGSHAHPGEGSASEADLGPWLRLGLIVAGMLAPALIAGVIGHGH